MEPKRPSSHTETGCTLSALLYLTVLKSDLAKPAANIRMISQYVQAAKSSETLANFKDTKPHHTL